MCVYVFLLLNEKYQFIIITFYPITIHFNNHKMMKKRYLLHCTIENKLILCFQYIQLSVAKVLTVIYGFTQFLIIINILIEFYKYQLCSVVVLFSLVLMVFLAICACLHPSEAFCICYSVVYFIAIPSLYLCLPIYAISGEMESFQNMK